MHVVFKWAFRLAAVGIVFFGIIVAVASSAFLSTLPDQGGTVSLGQLSDDVTLSRNINGIPYISAASHEDAARVLGYAHAQDRFWQMHVLRMVAQGRLSELFGRPTIDTDIFLRTIDLGGASEASFSVLSPEIRSLLEAYAEGVNSWLERDTGFLQARLPPEFMILGKNAEPWQPWHSLSILKVMALTLDGNLRQEIQRLLLASKNFSPREIDELVPYGPRENPPPLPDVRPVYGFGAQAGLATGDLATNQPEYVLTDLMWETGVTASNNWVVSGTRTSSGKPLLANDPHLELTSPSIFYLAHLSFDADEADSVQTLVGATLPGTPIIIAGRNDHLAWGLTTTVLDSQDLYIERLKGDDPGSYLTPDGWREFETEEITIEVSGAPPVSFTRRITRHGPVLPDNYRDISKIIPSGHVAALQWTALANDDTTAEGAINMNLSRSVGEFIDATSKMVSPMQSIVVADVNGDIGIIAPGRAPVREPANPYVGRVPVPGWLELYDWKGWIDHVDLPQMINPDVGAIATANANWLPEGYDQHITFDWDENYRQARVDELVIDTDDQHSPETMAKIQLDIFSPALMEFKQIAITQLAAGAGQDPEMLDSLRKWDGMMTADSPLPLIMTSWWKHAGEALFRDDLGADHKRFARGKLQPVIDALTITGTRDWCDDRLTNQVETCSIILARGLTLAVEELRKSYGDDWRNWRWGEAHKVRGTHRPFSSVGPLSKLFSVSPESAGGSYTLLRGRTDFRNDNPYINGHGSAFRGIYDLGNLDRSQYVITTGQSGHFLSRHYRDLADEWAEMRYIEIGQDPDLEDDMNVLVLTPSPATENWIDAWLSKLPI
ncbi:MAG: penicillin acylase family protein [Pseudomonadota bacterium]